MWLPTIISWSNLVKVAEGRIVQPVVNPIPDQQKDVRHIRHVSMVKRPGNICDSDMFESGKNTECYVVDF